MHDAICVQVIKGFNNLGEVIDHDSFLLEGQFEMLVDGPHQLEDVSERAEFQHESHIVRRLYDLEQSDDARMFHFRQYKLLHSRLVHFIHFIQLLQLHGLEGIPLIIILALHLEYFTV
jgi:hypothetical protein